MTATSSNVRQFTVEEANRSLPFVRVVVRDIVELYNDLHRRRERLASLRRRQGEVHRNADDPYELEITQMEDEIDTDVDRLQSFTEELEQVGVELRDPFLGIIDFPSRRDGKTIRLCWRPEDNAVDHWHRRDADCIDRLPLDNADPQPISSEQSN